MGESGEASRLAQFCIRVFFVCVLCAGLMMCAALTSGCTGSGSGSGTGTGASTSAGSGDTKIIEEANAAYNEVVSQYRAALVDRSNGADWTSLSGKTFGDRGKYPYVAVDMGIGGPSVYAISDLDADGIPELAISTSVDSETVLNVWDYYDGVLDLPVCSMYRYGYSLRTDGCVLSYGSGGATTFISEQFRYKDSALQLEKKLGCSCDAKTGQGDVLMTYADGTEENLGNNVQVAQSAYKQMQADHPLLTDLPWQSL